MKMKNDAGSVAIECPICGDSTWGPAGKVRRASLSRCGSCGLLATTHFLSENGDLGGLYDTTEEDYLVYNRQYREGRLASYRRWLRELEPWRKSGRLLEIGSGYGDFLVLAKEAGWNAVGVEISCHACAVARSKGCDVFEGVLEDAGLESGAFDAVVLWDVIEHLLGPDQLVKQAVDLLAPGGVLLMKTPDGRALMPTKNPLRSLYRNFVYPANTAEHVYHYTPEQLVSLVERHGAKKVVCSTDDTWDERIISGNSPAVRAIRWMIMGLAHWRHWPYEFVLVAEK